MFLDVSGVLSAVFPSERTASGEEAHKKICSVGGGNEVDGRWEMDEMGIGNVGRWGDKGEGAPTWVAC